MNPGPRHHHKSIHVNCIGAALTAAPRSARFVAGVLTSLLLASAIAGSATAAEPGVHLFKEMFGEVSQPSFTSARSLAVDQAGDDLLVVDGGANEQQQLEIKVASGAVGGTYKLSFG